MAATTRRATVDDAEAIATAHMRAWQVAYRGIVSDEHLDSIDLAERTQVWRANLVAETLARRFYERQGWSVNDATQEEEIGGDTIIERRYSLDLTQK